MTSHRRHARARPAHLLAGDGRIKSGHDVIVVRSQCVMRGRDPRILWQEMAGLIPGSGPGTEGPAMTPSSWQAQNEA